MAQQSSKPKWKVGSFFQQAVAGVESRLDLILAEEEEQQQSQSKSATGKPNQSGSMLILAHRLICTHEVPDISRSSSNARKNDRLQERLARAVVKNNAPGNVSSSSPPSRVASPVASLAASNDARSSLDVESNPESPDKAEKLPQSPPPQEETVDPRTSHDSSVPSRSSKEITSPSADDAASKDPGTEIVAETSEDTAGLTDQPADEPTEPPRTSRETAESTTDTAANGDDKTITQLREEHKTAESRWQEEMYGYIERIDALQSKLKYLAKDAADSAKQAAATADPGSVEKQLREKDERIALLLEEGQKLSKTEMDHRTAIKKLRQQLSDNSKLQTEQKKKTDRLERDLASAEARAKRAEAAEKRATGSLTSQSKISRDLDAVTSERDALSQTVEEMKCQLARAVARAEDAEEKAHSDALEQEKRHASALEEELTSIKIERDISEEKFKREISDLKEAIGQEKERARMLEAELKGEQSILESKMESLRSKAEEASSGVASDTQAKLLRQIETLQTQYAVASENWQALEGSLMARLANVEKERDEVSKREVELRRKIREVSLKVKKTEEELENAKETEQDLESRLEERGQELQKLEQKLQKASDDLKAAQTDLIEQKKVWDATWTQKLEEERSKIRDHSPSPMHLLRTESPVGFSRRSSNLEPVGSLSDHRPTSRRPSTLQMTSSEIGTPPRQNSFPASVANGVSIHQIPETPGISYEPDEFFTGIGTPSAHGGAQARGINDIISESTVGAGPSVQLVERMSATVRRLESERAASKDELARITTQRDEARQQVVDLMRESDEKKESDDRIQELEKRLEDLDQRYQTTLEMLGEKSEQVEELQADITDLKKIYRELVDSTMK